VFAVRERLGRLHVRYDKRADIHEAFLSLGCALICWQEFFEVRGSRFVVTGDAHDKK